MIRIQLYLPLLLFAVVSFGQVATFASAEDNNDVEVIFKDENGEPLPVAKLREALKAKRLRASAFVFLEMKETGIASPEVPLTQFSNDGLTVDIQKAVKPLTESRTIQKSEISSLELIVQVQSQKGSTVAEQRTSFEWPIKRQQPVDIKLRASLLAEQVQVKCELVSTLTGEPLSNWKLWVAGQDVTTDKTGHFSAKVPKTGFEVGSRNLSGERIEVVDFSVSRRELDKVLDKEKRIKISTKEPLVAGTLLLKQNGEQAALKDAGGYLKASQRIAEDVVYEYKIQVSQGRFALYPISHHGVKAGQPVKLSVGNGLEDFQIVSGETFRYPGAAKQQMRKHTVVLDKLANMPRPRIALVDAVVGGPVQSGTLTIKREGKSPYTHEFKSSDGKVVLPRKTLAYAGPLIVRSSSYKDKANKWPPPQDRPQTVKLSPLKTVTVSVKKSFLENSPCTVILTKSNRLMEDSHTSSKITKGDPTEEIQWSASEATNVAVFDAQKRVLFLKVIDFSSKDSIQVGSVKNASFGIELDMPRRYQGKLVPFLVDIGTGFRLQHYAKEGDKSLVKFDVPRERDYAICLEMPKGVTLLGRVDEAELSKIDKKVFTFDPKKNSGKRFYENARSLAIDLNKNK